MKKKLSTLINTLVISSIIYIALFVIDPENLQKTLKNSDHLKISLLVALHIAFYASNGYVINKITLSHFGINLNFKEWFGLSAVNTLANLVFPLKTGTLLKATYLKKKYNFEISKSAGILIFSSFTSLMSVLLAACLIFGFLELSNDSNHIAPWLSLLPENFLMLLFGATLGLFVIGIGMLFYLVSAPPFFLNLNKTKIHEIFLSLQESIKQLKKSKKLISLTILNSMISLTINIAILYCAFSAIGITIDIFSLSCLNLINTASFYISATPGNIGFQELII